MPMPGPLVFNLWARETAHPESGETCLAHGSEEKCRAEQAYLEQRAEQFEGRTPYPYRDFSIEEA